MNKCLFPFCLFLLFQATSLGAQKVLQIERYGKAESEKIYIGHEIDYRLNGNDYFLRATIEDFNIDNNVIVLADRYVPVNEINALRYYRTWPKAMGTSIFWFGIGWSSFAVVGTATDGDPSTSYRWSDALVTGTSAVTALILPKLFRRKILKIGKRKRLRMLDINFYPDTSSPILNKN